MPRATSLLPRRRARSCSADAPVSPRRALSVLDARRPAGNVRSGDPGLEQMLQQFAHDNPASGPHPNAAPLCAPSTNNQQLYHPGRGSPRRVKNLTQTFRRRPLRLVPRASTHTRTLPPKIEETLMKTKAMQKISACKTATTLKRCPGCGAPMAKGQHALRASMAHLGPPPLLVE